MMPGGTTQPVMHMATENNRKPETRGAENLQTAVQLPLPELFPSRREERAGLGDNAPNFGGADIISKSDLAMMRGRRKKHDQQKRNER
jgi:hypothetical protein